MRVLLTRPEPDAQRTARRLIQRGHEAVVAPITAIEETGVIPPKGPFAAVLLTSAHGAPFAARLSRDVSIFAVGERTAEMAREAGFAKVLEGPGEAKGLAALIAEHVPPGARLLHPAGRNRKPEPQLSLIQAGYEIATWECYAAVSVSQLPILIEKSLAERRIDAVLHYSRRHAALLRHLVETAGFWPEIVSLPQLCLSQDVAEALGRAHILVAPQPKEESLLNLLETLKSPPEGGQI